MRIYRNNLACSPLSWADRALAIVDRGDRGVWGQLLSSTTGRPAGEPFAISDEPAYCAWAMVAAAASNELPARWAVTYIVGDNADNVRVLREVTVENGTPTVGPAIRIAAVGAEPIFSERGGIVWTPEGWIVSLRMRVGAEPQAALARVGFDGQLKSWRTITPDDDSRNAPALAYGGGLVCAVGYEAGKPAGYAGGTWAQCYTPLLEDVGQARHRDGCDGTPLEGVTPPSCSCGALRRRILSLDVGAKCEEQQVAWCADAGAFLAHWARADMAAACTIRYRADRDAVMASALTLTPAGLAHAIAYNAELDATLLVLKDGAADLAVRQLDAGGHPIDLTDELRLATWDGRIGDYQASVIATPAGWLVSADFGDGSRLFPVAGALGAPLLTLNTPAPPRPPDPPPAPIPPWPRIHTDEEIRAYTAMTSPRWFGLFFERNHYSSEPSPAPCAEIVSRGGSDAWDRFIEAGDPKPVLADYRSIDRVPAEFLLGLYGGLEGGFTGPAFSPDVEERRHVLETDDDLETYLVKRFNKARARGVPFLFYSDGRWQSDEGQAFIREWLKGAHAAGVEVIPCVQCYAGRISGPHDQFSEEGLMPIEQSEADYRAGLEALRPHFARLAIARTLYTQTKNYPLTHIQRLQPVISRVANDYRVTFDLGFSWARPSGVTTVLPGVPSNREALLPIVQALSDASRAQPRPPLLAVATLTLLCSKHDGPAPLELGCSVHEPTGQLIAGAQARIEATWEGGQANVVSAVVTNGNALIRLHLPGRWSLIARTGVRQSGPVIVTVSKPESTRKPSRLRFC